MIEARLLSEIFAYFESAETKQEKQAILKKYWNPSMKLFLEYAFNPNIKFDVIPPKSYRPAVEPAGLNVSYLDMEVNKLYRFIEGHPQRPPGLTPEKQTKQKSPQSIKLEIKFLLHAEHIYPVSTSDNRWQCRSVIRQCEPHY